MALLLAFCHAATIAKAQEAAPTNPTSWIATPPKAAPGPDSSLFLYGPIFSEGKFPPPLNPAQAESSDKLLPINLATALRLAGARPFLIAAAEASAEAAAAEFARAKVAWLPNVYAGASYYRHEGATQGQSGNFYNNTKDQFLAGGGVTLKFGVTDAIFAPLAARQVQRARESDVETARNDALLAVAEAYFAVQQARGRLAGAQDVLGRSQDLRARIEELQKAPLPGPNFIRPTDEHRARAQLAEFESAVSAAREDWRLASADLTQVLRLDPTATVTPQEPPSLRVTLISPQQPSEALIPIGLTYRPELASQQALVQAALVRIRQERIRPLVPSLVLEGGSAPGGYFMGGEFASSVNGSPNPTQPRMDVTAQLYWGLDNLGLGNRAKVRGRQAEQQQLLIELFRIQDRVAAEIARAHAQVASAEDRAAIGEKGLKEALLAYSGSFEEFSKVLHVGNSEVLVRRTFEVVDALRSLSRAYETYFISVGDYNRAQFRLYRSLGYPAGLLSCERLPANPAK
jgi:outer membrane protein TolC